MASLKFEIEKFNGENDYGLWKMKMRAILVQQGLEKALLPDVKWPAETPETQKGEIQSKAFSAIILSLSDNVLRSVSNVNTVTELWEKLEEVYRSKAMPNRIYMKEKFFAFKMDDSKSIENGIDEFNIVVLDLEELEVKIDEEDKAVVLLNSLPKSLKNFKDTLKFGRDVLTVDLILKSLNAKLLDIKKGQKDAAQTEALIAKGRGQ